MVLVLWPADQPRDWLFLGTLRGHRVEYVIDGTDALVRVGDWISPGGARPVVDELRELFERSSGARAPSRPSGARLEIDATTPLCDPRRE